MERKILVVILVIPPMIVEKETQVGKAKLLLLKLNLLHMVILPIRNTRLIMIRNLSLK